MLKEGLAAATQAFEVAEERQPVCRVGIGKPGQEGRSEVSEVIGALSRAEGCWTFDARDRMPRQSRATAHHLGENASTVTRTPSRERVRSSTHLRRCRTCQRRSADTRTASARHWTERPSLHYRLWTSMAAEVTCRIGWRAGAPSLLTIFRPIAPPPRAHAIPCPGREL